MQPATSLWSRYIDRLFGRAPLKSRRRPPSLQRHCTPLAAAAEVLEQRALLSAVAAPSGIVSWWTGNNTTDDLVGPNEGALANGAGFAAGQVGDAFNFDGIDDNFQAPTAGLPTGNANRTIELWV